MILKNIVLSLGVFVLGTAFIVQLKNYSPISSNVSGIKILSMPISEEWKVLSVHDGDTIKAEKNGIVERVRVCGIDAPEISQPLGKQSRDYLRSLVSLNKPVQISIVDSDRYGRKIGEIFLGDKFINEEMTKSGMAYGYDRYKNCPNQIAIGNGEAIAQSNNLGVWNGNHEKPWDYRKLK